MAEKTGGAAPAPERRFHGGNWGGSPTSPTGRKRRGLSVHPTTRARADERERIEDERDAGIARRAGAAGRSGARKIADDLSGRGFDAQTRPNSCTACYGEAMRSLIARAVGDGARG